MSTIILIYKKDEESQPRKNINLKNIPIPTQESYLLQLMEKIEMAIKRVRWKTIQFSNNEDNNSKTEWYALKSLSSPRPMKELTPFKNEFH